jgi:hypothetical protein
VRPGGRSRTLVRLRRNKEFADIAELSASTTRVAIFVQHSTGGEQSWVDWSLLLSGPIGGRLRTAAGTDRPSGPIVDHAPEVDGGH